MYSLLRAIEHEKVDGEATTEVILFVFYYNSIGNNYGLNKSTESFGIWLQNPLPLYWDVLNFFHSYVIIG